MMNSLKSWVSPREPNKIFSKKLNSETLRKIKRKEIKKEKWNKWLQPNLKNNQNTLWNNLVNSILMSLMKMIFVCLKNKQTKLLKLNDKRNSGKNLLKLRLKKRNKLLSKKLLKHSKLLKINKSNKDKQQN